MDAGVDATPRPRPRRLTGRVLALLLAATLAGVGIGAGLHFLLARNAAVAGNAASVGLHGQAIWPAGTRLAPPITRLHDQDGRLFSLSALRGRAVAMTFFDSHCRQACPLEGRALAASERSLPAAARPTLVIVSINPLDTPASARRAARRWGLAGLGSWHWLIGTHATLARVWNDYRIFVAPQRGDITHTEALYLIDRSGYERAGYLYPFVPRFVASDLRWLSRPGRGHA